VKPSKRKKGKKDRKDSRSCVDAYLHCLAAKNLNGTYACLTHTTAANDSMLTPSASLKSKPHLPFALRLLTLIHHSRKGSLRRDKMSRL
jgi:hypothetical protein